MEVDNTTQPLQVEVLTERQLQAQIAQARLLQIFEILQDQMGASDPLVATGMGMIKMTLETIDPEKLLTLLTCCLEILQAVKQWDWHPEEYEAHLEPILTKLMTTL